MAETYKVGAGNASQEEEESEEEKYEEEFEVNVSSTEKNDFSAKVSGAAAQANGLSSKTGTHKSNKVIEKHGGDKSSMDGRGSDATKQTQHLSYKQSAPGKLTNSSNASNLGGATPTTERVEFAKPIRKADAVRVGAD